MKMLIAAVLVGLAASATSSAADNARAQTRAADPKAQATVGDATAQAKADYETAKARCSSQPERNRTNCLNEAKARYQAHLQGTKREHRDETPVRPGDPAKDKPAGSARGG